jgi:hypothetical protein
MTHAPQLDMFGHAPAGIIGLEVRLPHGCQCGHDLLIVGQGKGPHAAALTCSRCSRHCGWMSHESHTFLTETVRLFGRPSDPIEIRPTGRSAAASGAVAVNKPAHLETVKD